MTAEINGGSPKSQKPPGSSWTDEQWRAIVCRGEDTLVTAGAGSGKTRVLVERVLQRIMEGDPPQEIDRFLVVTFTNAAAAEMKQRIGAALEKAIRENPEVPHLRRQLLLLNRASISTVHSFCMEVIQRYFYLRNLDPSFRILDETEAELLRAEVLEELLEEYYENNEAESPFYRLADIYSDDRGDRSLQVLVLRLYDFSRSHLQPERWLHEKAAAFVLDGAGELEGTAWIQELLRACRLELKSILGRLEEALRLCREPGGPEPYAGSLEDDIAALQEICSAAGSSWGDLSHALQLPVFGRLTACRGSSYEEDLKERVKKIRDECKKELGKLKEQLFRRPLAEQAEDLILLAPLLEALVELVLAFAGRYRQAKEEKGAADFSDLEHYALQILSSPVPGSPDSPGDTTKTPALFEQGSEVLGSPDSPGDALLPSPAVLEHGDTTTPSPAALEHGDILLPSAAALEYRERFSEVLVDEYQDINAVQEAILKLIAVPGPGGNMFMVGDVKQSIYRFRLAEPELFLQKYKGYYTGSLPGESITLARNFRSRREILAGVNYLFGQIMDETVGEIQYDREVRLLYGASYPDSSSEEGENPYAPELLLIDRSGAPDDGERTPVEGDGAPDEGEGTFAEGDNAPGGGNAFPTDGNRDSAGDAGEEELTEMAQAAAEEEWEKAALEGRLIAQRIRELMGDGVKRRPFSVYDKNTQTKRAVAYRDIVILLRSALNWAIPVMDELRRYGIPAYADLGTGYFEAVEVEVMLSLLKIIDNPFQDIPLAAVLRSPLVGLTADDLARIRTRAPRKSFYDALQEFCRDAQKDTANSKSTAGGGICSDNAGAGNNGSSSVGESGRGNGISAVNGISDGSVKNGDAGDVKNGSSGGPFSPLQEKLKYFLKQLYAWQDEARQGSLAELLWRIYGDTGYYELVGGMPGGDQRQANLRALYDRARQYETTSLRGLFRFLRFIERLRDRGGDLGAARALGEQEDVVRIITVHKSKGLEYPIVFVAGLSKQFNLQDLRQGFLLHKELGFGPKYIDAGLGVSYPTLPWLALKKRLSRELLAEEMRILYVALTRAEEKLILVGTAVNLVKDVQRWAEAARGKAQLLEPGYRLRAKSFLDWIGPALLRHRSSEVLRRMLADPGRVFYPGEEEQSFWNLWNVRVVGSRDVIAGEGPGAAEKGEEQILWEKVARLEPVPGGGKWSKEIKRRLEWSYPCRAAAEHYAKVSVSEMKKLHAAGLPGDDADEAPWVKFWPQTGPRPRFLEESSLTAAERGTAYHAVMQYISFECAAGPPAAEEISRQMEEMVAAERITEQEREAVDPDAIAAFFETPLGKRVLGANRVRREVPFSMALPAEEVYPGYHDYSSATDKGNPKGKHSGKEPVLIQGVIDCLTWEDDGGVLLIDFKSDHISGVKVEALRERYRLQLELYSRAVEEIWKVKVKGKYLYFFDGGTVVSLDEQ